MAKFSEIFNALETKSKATKNGRKAGATFSKKDFSSLAGAMLNEYDYETEVIKTKNGEFEEEKTQPVKAFRDAFIGQVLMDAGVDKQEAAKKAAEYHISSKQAETLYPVLTETVYQYMKAGRSFTFPNKKDFSGSIKLRDVAEHDSEHTDRESGKVTKTHIKAHKSLVKKCGAPKWCKKKI